MSGNVLRGPAIRRAAILIAGISFGFVGSGIWHFVQFARWERIVEMKLADASERVDIAQRRELNAHHSRYALYIELAGQAWHLGDVMRQRTLLDQCRAPNSVERPAFEWRFLLRHSQGLTDTTLKLGKGAISSLAFSPDDNLLAAGSLDGAIKIVAMGQAEAQSVLLRSRVNVAALVYASDDMLISAGGTVDGRGGIVRWNSERWDEQGRFVGSNSKVASLALSPDARILASGDIDGTVQLWDPGTGKELASFDAVTGHYLRGAPGHAASVWCVAFSPDGQTLATGSGDRTVKLWDFRAGRVLATLGGHRRGLRALAFSPTGARLAAGCGDGSITLWEPKEGRNLATLRGHQGSITALCFTPDGRTLASASMDGTVRLWEPEMGERLLRLERHAGPLLCAAFDPSGNILAAGGQNGTVRLWRTASEEEVEGFALR